MYDPDAADGALRPAFEGLFRGLGAAARRRDEASRLARGDAPAALQLARGMPDPWYKAQALATVARWIEDDHVERIARESVAAACAGEDHYSRSAVMAWPIAALVERGRHESAMMALARARRFGDSATPNSSRANALLLLLQAAWPLGRATRRSIVEDLAGIQREDSFWRVGLALVDALRMCVAEDEEFARGIAAQMPDGSWNRKALRSLDAGALTPRRFF